MLDNIDQKVVIENFWNSDHLKNILKNLAETQIKTGFCSQSFLYKFFENLTSEKKDPIDSYGWVGRFRFLLLYILFSKSQEERQRKEEMVFKYIVRAVNIIYKVNFREISQICKILKICCKHIHGLQEELSEIFTNLYNENAHGCPMEWPDEILNIPIFIKKCLDWQYGGAPTPIPCIILGFLNRIAYCLEKWSVDKIREDLSDELKELTRNELDNFDIKFINWENCKQSDKIAKYIIKLFIDFGIENMNKKLNYIEGNRDSYNKMQDYKQSQLEVFKECSECFAFKAIFDQSNHFAKRQLLISEFLDIFQCSLDSSKLKGILYELNNYASTIILEEPEMLPTSTETELNKIIHYKAAAAAYKNLGLNIENLQNIKYDLFKFPIRKGVLGVTLFGGTILLDISLFDKDDDMSECFLKITFANEIANLLRRRSQDGFYNGDIETPNVEEIVNCETLASIKKKINQQLESELFGSCATKLNKRQIEYINHVRNWNNILPNFRCDLRSLKSKDLFVYHSWRAENGVYRIDRVPHSEA